jgi:hypothetical protein
MAAPIPGLEVPSWWANVLMTIVGLLLLVTSRSKNRNPPSCPASLKVLVIIVDKALLPDPARPWIHSILCSPLASFAQSTTKFKISVLVFGRYPVRIDASIVTGSILSRISWPSVHVSWYRPLIWKYLVRKSHLLNILIWSQPTWLKVELLASVLLAWEKAMANRLRLQGQA